MMSNWPAPVRPSEANPPVLFQEVLSGIIVSLKKTGDRKALSDLDQYLLIMSGSS